MDPVTTPPASGDRQADPLPDLGGAHGVLAHIVDAITNPLFVKDERHRLVLVNDAFCGILGRTHEQLIGRTDFDFVPAEEARVFQAKDRLVFETGAPDENEEPLTDAAGKQHWIVTRKSLIKTDDGKRYIVGVITDITERKRMELDLRKANESLKEAMDRLGHTERLATIGQVAATVSHELRNPLGAIRNSMALIHQLTAGKQLGLDRALERTERNIERCATIINALLEFTHKKEITRTPTVVRQWLTAVLEEYRLPGGLALERDLHSDDMAAIDHERFGHVIVNLVDNAVQALRDPAWHGRRITRCGSRYASTASGRTCSCPSSIPARASARRSCRASSSRCSRRRTSASAWACRPCARSSNCMAAASAPIVCSAPAPRSRSVCHATTQP
jgi:two-component system, NtrC family, sensor kinase